MTRAPEPVGSAATAETAGPNGPLPVHTFCPAAAMVLHAREVEAAAASKNRDLFTMTWILLRCRLVMREACTCEGAMWRTVRERRPATLRSLERGLALESGYGAFVHFVPPTCLSAAK
jgi:hypothetical protein